MEVECINYKEVGTGTFSGFADIYIPEYKLEILGCTLFKKDEKRWLNLPVRVYKNHEGIEKYSPIIRFREQNEFREFCIKAKEAVDRYNVQVPEKAQTYEEMKGE